MEEVYYWQCAVPLEYCIERIVFSTPLFPSCEEGILNPLPSPLPFQKGEGCNRCALSLAFFSKTYPSFLTLKEGSTAFPKPFSPQGTRDVTAPPRRSEPLRFKVGGASEPSPVFLCGMEPPCCGLLGSALH